MAKIQSAGDGHYLYPQPQFGEDQCMQFRVIVVTDPHTNPQTHRQDQLQYNVPQLASVKCKEEVLQMCETEIEIMDTLRSRKKRWMGHILRHDSLLKTKLEGQIQGKKVVGDQEQCSLIGY